MERACWPVMPIMTMSFDMLVEKGLSCKRSEWECDESDTSTLRVEELYIHYFH